MAQTAKLKSAAGRAAKLLKGAGACRLTTYAAAGAYCAFMSLAPLALLAFAAVSHLPVEREALVESFLRFVPESLRSFFSGIAELVTAAPAAAAPLGAVLALASASSAFLALLRGMDAAYGDRRSESGVRFRLRGLLWTAAAVAAGVLVFWLYARSSALLGEKAPGVSVLLRSRGRWPVEFLLLTLVFSLLCGLMPAGRRALLRQLPGAALAAAACTAFTALFSLTASFTEKYGIYGLLGMVFAAMLWLYWCLYFLLLGAYANACLERRGNGGAGPG